MCKLCAAARHDAVLPAQYVEHYRAPAAVSLTGLVSACRDQPVLAPVFAGIAQGRETLLACQPQQQQKCT